jgi:electron transfer flavoprotein alpha/beta subunit
MVLTYLLIIIIIVVFIVKGRKSVVLNTNHYTVNYCSICRRLNSSAFFALEEGCNLCEQLSGSTDVFTEIL